jgi:hypothetical protein
MSDCLQGIQIVIPDNDLSKYGDFFDAIRAATREELFDESKKIKHVHRLFNHYDPDTHYKDTDYGLKKRQKSGLNKCVQLTLVPALFMKENDTLADRGPSTVCVGMHAYHTGPYLVNWLYHKNMDEYNQIGVYGGESPMKISMKEEEYKDTT